MFFALFVFLFRQMHKLQSHQDLAHRPAGFYAAGCPSHVVGNTVAFPVLDIKRACPRAVKEGIVAMDLAREQERGDVAPKRAEFFLARRQIRVREGKRQPVVGIKQIHHGITVVGKQGTLTRVIARAARLVSRIPFGNGTARLPVRIQIGHDAAEPFVMLLLARYFVQHGKRKKQEKEEESFRFLEPIRLKYSAETIAEETVQPEESQEPKEPRKNNRRRNRNRKPQLE